MSPLERKILDEIERRNLAPKPAAYFLARRSVFWFLAALSVLLGGISVAFGLFAIEDYAATGGRRVRDIPFDELLTGLPVIWLLVFALVTASAVMALRLTRRGYRLGLASRLTAVVAASLLLGVALNIFDIGRRAHEFLAARLPAYAAFTYVPYAEWSRPDQGYLGGEVLSVDNASLRLKAFDGAEWLVDITQARAEDIQGSLVDEGDIAVRGTRTGPMTFRASVIAPFD